MALRAEVDYSGIPEHMRKGARLWIEDGIMTGHFLTAVMTNNLTQAFTFADEKNTAAMEDWVNWLYWEIPGDCWGSEENVARWRTTRMVAPIEMRMKEKS
jgi:hypothetical protein